MNVQHLEWIGFGLFVASEIIGMSRLESNSLLQAIVALLLKTYPYEPKNRNPWSGRR